jgi:pilus assembly protein CpaB
MNRRLSIIVLCAFTLSICASYLVYRAVGARPATVERLRTTPVVVAARDIDAGSLIRNIDLKTVGWPGAPPTGAINRPDAILNRGVTSSIYEGEPVTETRLAGQGSGGGLAGTIPSGMRACAVRVNEVVGVAGFAVPGMRVDVLISGMPPGGDPLQGPMVRTLLQNIQVLSAGTNFQRDQQGKPEQAQVVNLLVTPAQAEVLSLASNEMHIQLVLRNPMDIQVATPPGTVMSDLFGGHRALENVRAWHPPGGAPNIGHSATPTPVIPVRTTQITPTPAANASFVVEELNGAVSAQVKFNRAQEKQ